MNYQYKLLGVILMAPLLITSVALVGAVPDQTERTETEDWPAPRADPGRTGTTDDTGPQPYGNVSWFESKRNGGRETSAAVVSEETVYLAYGGGNAPDGVIEAYNASSGQTKWKQPNVGEPIGSPTVDDGRVYAATYGPESPEFTTENVSGLYALDASTGVIEWRQNDTITTPLVADEQIITSVRQQGANEDLSPHRNVTALDPETGERVWTSDVHGKPVGYANGSLYVTDNQTHTIYALNPSNGALQWQTTVAEDANFNGWIAVTDEIIVFTNDRGPFRSTFDPQPQKTVYAHSASDGAKLWERNVSANLTGSSPQRLSAPVIANGMVYLTSDDDHDSLSEDVSGQDVGAVHALDAETGETVWRFQTSVSLTSAPAVANETVYVAGIEGPSWENTDNAVYALDAENGEEEWNLSGARGMTPVWTAVADGQLFITNHFGSGIPQSMSVQAIKTTDTQPPSEYQVGDDEPVDKMSESELSPVDDFENPPTDPDGDGKFEDVNGDSEFNIVDVQALFANRDDSTVQNNPEKFDFNGDGTFDVVDVQALFNELTEENEQ